MLVAERDFDWGQDRAAILAIVGRYFSDLNVNGCYPHPHEAALQRELRALASLQQLRRTIGRSGACGMAVTGLGLAGLAEAPRNALLYAIALCLGFPTSTDQRTRRVAWDIRARAADAQASRFVTFSNGSATPTCTPIRRSVRCRKSSSCCMW